LRDDRLYPTYFVQHFYYSIKISQLQNFVNFLVTGQNRKKKKKKRNKKREINDRNSANLPVLRRLRGQKEEERNSACIRRQ
jgi:hypothetical protein